MARAPRTPPDDEMRKKKESMPWGEASPAVPAKPKSSVRFNFDRKHGKMMPKGTEVGKKHSMRALGRIVGMRSDEYGHSVDMDLDSVEHDTDHDREAGEPRSLTKALRNRHSGTGRFTA